MIPHAQTVDVFEAIADPMRRRIIDLLGAAEQRSVSELIDRLGAPQPAVSKQLRVLRTARLVSVNRRGRHRLYRLNAAPLKTIHHWTKTYERFWNQQFDRIKARAEQKARENDLHKESSP